MTRDVASEFRAIYEANVRFVWRNLRRLGVIDAALDDATQEVFVVVYRRLAEFEGRSALRTWLYAIAVMVARDHRRLRQKQRVDVPLPDTLRDGAPGPHESAVRADAVRVLDALLAELDDDKREAFVLCELEELSGPEIAEVLGVNLNTVYARIRAARAEFERALARHQRSNR